jgi:hypothetical protein
MRSLYLVPANNSYYSKIPMSRERSRVDQPPSLLFVNEDPRTARVPVGTLVSHARRFQARKRIRGKRSSALQEAKHARSLVGWQTPASSSTDRTRVGTPADDAQTQEQKPNEDTVMQPIAVGFDFLALGGLRMEPFNSFPTGNTKAVMHMVDYRIVTSRWEDNKTH